MGSHLELALDLGEADSVRVTNLSPTLPELGTAKERSAFVRAAATRDLSLSEDAVYAIARALISPATATALIRQDLLTTEVVGPTDIELLQANVLLTELFILMQPRAGGFAHSVDPPTVRGCANDNEVAPQLEVTFDDEAHLRRYIVETVTQTRVHGRDYSSSILAKRVSRAGLAHVMTIRFRDGSDRFDVVCVRDGITRVVSSWAALNPDLSSSELAEVIADHLLSRKEVRSATASEGAARARGRDQFNQELRGRFVAGTSDEEPTEDAIRIGQTYSLPMQICLAIRVEGQVPVSPEATFDDTIQAVIASVHSEFKPWEQTATESVTILRALPRAVHANTLDQQVADLAAGNLPVEAVPKVFGREAPPTALWRAVYLLSFLTHDVEFDGIKRQLRELTGLGRIENKTYVSHLASLVDLPWRRAKTATERQARRAWANGGPIPPAMLGSDWDPVATDDFLTLVDDALAGDRHAKYTLMIAGGVALITDKLLLSNTGSALASGLVPFRANVDVIVEGLGENRRGLCILAHAANAFDPERNARNSFTKKELAANPSLSDNTYVVPRPGRRDPMRVARDKAGKVIPIRTYDVVYASDPARADREEAEAAALHAKHDETDTDKASRLRRNVVASLTDGVESMQALIDMATKDAAIVGGPFGDQDTFNSVKRLADRLQLLTLMSAGTVPGESSDVSQSGAEDGDDADDGDDERD